MEQLEGKVAVITGGGSGIGEAIATACAEAGMRVVVADLEADQAERVANALRETGTEALAVQMDVTDLASFEALADQAYDAFGAVHLLCNNAGVFTRGPITESTTEDWQWLFSVNVFGVVNGLRAFVPRMRAQGGEAHIVNTGSMASIAVLSTSRSAAYSASKHAVLGLTETLRNELAEDGIGVSILCPSVVNTRLFDADRNAPEALRDRISPSGGQTPAGAAPPRPLGGIVLDAVRANRFWIIPHPERRDGVAERCEGLLAAFDEAALAQR